MVHSGKTLLQTKADRAKGNAVGQSDIPDEDDDDDQEDDGEVCCNDDDYDDNWDEADCNCTDHVNGNAVWKGDIPHEDEEGEEDDDDGEEDDDDGEDDEDYIDHGDGEDDDCDDNDDMDSVYTVHMTMESSWSFGMNNIQPPIFCDRPDSPSNINQSTEKVQKEEGNIVCMEAKVVTTPCYTNYTLPIPYHITHARPEAVSIPAFGNLRASPWSPYQLLQLHIAISYDTTQ